MGPATSAPASETPAPTSAQPPADTTMQPSVSYKNPEAVSAAAAPPKLPTTNRPTTYRPDAIRAEMPVLSPDLFRKPQQ
jgi:hypothetical protein